MIRFADATIEAAAPPEPAPTEAAPTSPVDIERLGDEDHDERGAVLDVGRRVA